MEISVSEHGPYFYSPLPKGRKITMVVVPMQPATQPYQVEVKVTGTETSLKEVLTTETDLMSAVYAGYAPQNPPLFRVYRRPLESLPSLKGKCLHVLLLKSEGYKFPRNPNAHGFELYCGTYFFGPFIAAINSLTKPYSLESFATADYELVQEYNQRVHKIYPPPYESPYPSMKVAPGDVAADLSKKEEEFNDFFFMYRYKTSYCPQIASKHDWTQCYYAHRITDYRRPPDKYAYSPEECGKLDKDTGECPDGDGCRFSHSTAERLYHPLKYKTNPCDCLKKAKAVCKRGRHCAFYHHASEKRNPLSDPLLKRQAEEVKEYVSALDSAASAAAELRKHISGSPVPDPTTFCEEVDFEARGKRHRWTVHATQEKLLKKEQEKKLALAGGFVHVRSALNLAQSNMSSLVNSFCSSKGLPYYTELAFEDRSEEGSENAGGEGEIEDKFHVLDQIGTPTNHLEQQLLML